MATKKAVKQVQVLARYAHKTDGQLNGIVTYCVRSSNGKDFYYTTLINGKASGCSCPAKKPCYHMTQLAALEVARSESPEQKEAREWAQYRSELAVKLSKQYMTVEIVEQVAEQLVAPVKVVMTAAQEEVPPIAMELPAELRGYKKTAVSADISTKGSLNGAQQSAGLLMALPSRKAKAS